jgi:lipopolysaccharide export system protein LptA
MLKRYILFILFFTTSFWCEAQKLTRVEILGARVLEYDQRGSGRVKKLIGDVKFKQGKTLLYCDSAFLFEDSNFVIAYNNVRINDNDSVFVYADYLEYSGDKKLAKLERNVRMNDNNMNLTCSELNFDMNNNIAYYTLGGKIINKENVLTSKVGYYYTNAKEFYYRKEVFLLNPNYTMTCDTLKYSTSTHVTDFYGPTNIVSKGDKIYCENGWYNTDKEIAQFNKNAIVTNKSNKLKADSIYYERKTEFGKAFKNIELTDTVNKIIIYGDYGELIGKEKRSFVTRRAMAKKLMENDSMFLFADTIFSYQKFKIQKQIVKAYYNAKILKNDIQAVCDSLVYNYSDSTINLYHDPIIWSGQNQITADTIVMFINNSKIDSFNLNNNAFIASREASNEYNQVKGKNMKGFFENNKIKYMLVFGNGQSIYFAKEADSTYIGVNVVDCSEMEFYFNDNKIGKGKFITQPDAVFYSLDEMKSEELRLKGFKWQIARRPNIRTVKQRIKNKFNY